MLQTRQLILTNIKYDFSVHNKVVMAEKVAYPFDAFPVYIGVTTSKINLGNRI